MKHAQHTYCFILGLNHSLSKVEIVNVLAQKNIDFELGECSQEVLIISTKTKLDTLSIEDFGGVVKFVEIIDTVPLKAFFADETDFSATIDVAQFIPQNVDKITFGLSVYGAGCKIKDLNTAWYMAPKLCGWMRNMYTWMEIKSNFLPLLERRLSTVAVDKKKLLTQGFELCLCVGKDNVYIGLTRAIQDYKNYSFRDYGRPERDLHSGMIPPKLAKMLINLAGKDQRATLYDPFCGSGTMLEEMILLGFKSVVGSDVSETAITDSQQNLDWLFEHYPKINKESFNINLFQSDVKECAQKLAGKAVDAVVTEPYLGSANARNFNKVQAGKEIDKLEEIYLAAFSQFKQILGKNGTVVIVFPVLKIFHEFYYLQILEKLAHEGWAQKPYLPARYDTEKNRTALNLSLTDRGSIVFFRPDQTVSREIMVFTQST